LAEQAEADDVHDEDLDILDNGDADDQGDKDQNEDDNAADEDDDEEVVVQFGDEAAPASEGKSEPDLLRTLRAANRQLAKEVATLKRSAPQPKPVVIEAGPKPTMDDCYSADDPEAELATRLEAWIERKRQATEAEAQAAQGVQARQDEFNKDLTRFQTAKAALGVRDFEDAKDAAVSVLTQDQISGIVVAAEDAAKVIYALGKHPAKLEALKAITNPVKFIAAVAKLEGTLKVTKTSRKAPELDTPVRGSAPLSASKDKHLAKLEAEAERTNDRSKVIAYKREQRTSQAK
jgi:hypothetical protein